MALWWLLRAGVARVGLVGVPFPCGAGRTLEGLEGFGGYGGFEAWQTAALNAYKKPLLRPWGALEPLLWPCGDFCVREWRMLGGLRPWGALEPLLWPCGGFCVREWRVLGLLGYLFPAELAGLLEGLEGLEGFGGFEAWQTAALNAYKKPLLRPWGALEPLLWPCGGFCVREWLVGVPVPCGAGRTFGGFGGFGGFEAWQTAALNAYKKPLLRPWGALEPLLWPCGGFCVREWRVYAYKKPLLRPWGALEPLLWPCGGFCVREWRVLGLLGYLFPAELAGLLEGLEGFGGYGEFEAWQTAALNAYKRSHCCGRGVLLSHCCGLVVAFACGSSGRGVLLSHCCGLVVAFACGSGACWACWGTFSLRSWPDFWKVWRVLDGMESLRPGKRQP